MWTRCGDLPCASGSRSSPRRGDRKPPPCWRRQRDGRSGSATPSQGFGLYLNFHPTDFTQVNLGLNQRLVADVVQALGPPNGLTADLFCGIGNFSLPLARRGHRLLGLEGDAGCIDRAKGNAALNGMGGRCEFAVADLYKAPELPTRLGAALVDPPRSGLGSALVETLSERTDRLAYVSCNPATFARKTRAILWISAST